VKFKFLKLTSCIYHKKKWPIKCVITFYVYKISTILILLKKIFCLQQFLAVFTKQSLNILIILPTIIKNVKKIATIN
jgi:hypothetical protein